ncbi:hypothetical protein [Salmonirosea aquatica]|uniref:Lipoprotein n=1 Tax=Salmonirosea aquatica TaxID=2654236 RepID=A0A7C9FZ80_9BACT|nr:hypothetical protein [Cytophagaceae bacterium SJW1-29]
MMNVIKLLSKGVLLLLLIGSCKNNPGPNCLPYEGKIIDSSPCGGTIVDVTNRNINSQYYLPSQKQVIPNTLGVRLPDSIAIDSSRTIYFDFRELAHDEIYPCPALFSAPSRQVAVTRISYDRCPDQ